MDDLNDKKVTKVMEGVDGDLVPEIDVDEMMAKYDKESSFRRYKGVMSIIISIIALAFAGYQLYTAQFGIFTAQVHRPIHLCFVLLLAFLLYPARKKSRERLTAVDVLLALATVAVGIYMVANHWELAFRAGDYTTLDLIIGAVGIFLVIEATRRVVGLPIVIVALVFLLYNYFGKYIPVLCSTLVSCRPHYQSHSGLLRKELWEFRWAFHQHLFSCLLCSERFLRKPASVNSLSILPMPLQVELPAVRPRLPSLPVRWKVLFQEVRLPIRLAPAASPFQ